MMMMMMLVMLMIVLTRRNKIMIFLTHRMADSQRGGVESVSPNDFQEGRANTRALQMYVPLRRTLAGQA